MITQLWRSQDPHSLYVSAAGLLLGATLVLDIVLREDDRSLDLHWILLGLSVVLTMTTIGLGSGFPLGVGIVCVVLFTLATLFFLSPWGSEQSDVSSAQELPIVALYLGWFVPRPYGRWIMMTITALLAIMMTMNPLFHPHGVLGVPTAVQIIVIGLLCFEIGTILWRRTEQQIENDKLTGVLSRHAFFARVARALTQRRTDPIGTLVLLDFDRFKQLNDTRGHAYGDAALVGTIASLRAGLGRSGLVGRIGGDEFAILLEGISELEAERIVSRLREGSPHAWSWGSAQLRVGEAVEEAFHRADAELFAAKKVRP